MFAVCYRWFDCCCPVDDAIKKQKRIITRDRSKLEHQLQTLHVRVANLEMRAKGLFSKKRSCMAEAMQVDSLKREETSLTDAIMFLNDSMAELNSVAAQHSLGRVTEACSELMERMNAKVGPEAARKQAEDYEQQRKDAQEVRHAHTTLLVQGPGPPKTMDRWTTEWKDALPKPIPPRPTVETTHLLEESVEVSDSDQAKVTRELEERMANLLRDDKDK